MPVIKVRAVPHGEELVGHCPCCSRPVHKNSGVLETQGDPGELLAGYWYWWPEGHKGLFTLAVSPWSEADNSPLGVIIFSCRAEPEEGIHYSIKDPDDEDRADFREVAPVLTRAEALEGKAGTNLFNLADAIIENDPRLSSRILSQLGLE